jgi:hypothetical protein
MSREGWGREPGENSRVWARRDEQDARARAGGGGSNGGNRNNRNHDRGTCVCMVLTFIGEPAAVAWHAVAPDLALDPARFL